MPRNTGRSVAKREHKDWPIVRFGSPLYKQRNKYCSWFVIVMLSALTAFSGFFWIPLIVILFQWLVFLTFWEEQGPKELSNYAEPPDNWDELTWDERIWLNEQMIIAGFENGFAGMPHVDDYGNPYGPRYREIRPVKDRAMIQAFVNGIEVPRLLIGDWARLTHDSRMLIADQNFHMKTDVDVLILDEQDRQLELREKVSREKRQMACHHLDWIDVTSVSDSKRSFVCGDCGKLITRGEVERWHEGESKTTVAVPKPKPETDWSEAWGQDHADMVRQHRYKAPETSCFCEGCQTRKRTRGRK